MITKCIYFSGCFFTNKIVMTIFNEIIKKLLIQIGENYKQISLYLIHLTSKIYKLNLDKR